MSTKQDDCTGNEQENESNKKNWAETVTFCKDPTLPFAASGTINGELFIWDISKQVLLFVSVVKLSLIEKMYQSCIFSRFLGTK